jgi:hypothetical protein
MATNTTHRLPAAFRVLTVAATGCLLVLVATGATAQVNNRDTYFGTVREIGGVRLERLRELLMEVEDTCVKLGRRCEAGDELLGRFAGDLDLSDYPTLVVYIDDNGAARTNVLLHRHRVTPFLDGESNLWVVVFSERELDLDVSLTTLWQQASSINEGLRAVFVTEGQRTQDARDASGIDGLLELATLSGEGDDVLWFGATRFFIEPLSAYNLSVTPAGEPGELDLDFREIRAAFSNSTDRSVTFGLGLGATFDTTLLDQPVLDGVQIGSTNLDLYLMLDIYIRKPAVLRPITSSFWGRYRPSIGIALATNIQFWDAREYIVGVSFGHLFGRHGLVVGANFIDPFSEDGEDREDIVRPYVALMFRF